MSDKESQPESIDAAPAPPSRLSLLVMRLQHVLLGHWKRTLAAGVTFVVLIVGFTVMWTYTATLTIESERAKLDEALVALDAGEQERARSLVRHVLNSGVVPRREYGVPLFVLGAVKMHDAGSDVLPERRRTEYLVASRYLSESRSYGFAPGRDKQGLLLLGASLVESFQTAEGIEVLTAALEVEPKEGGPLNVAIHRLLAEAYTQRTRPDFPAALTHISLVIDDDSLTPQQRAAALILQAKILGQLERFDEAFESLTAVPADAFQHSTVLVTHGKLLLDGVEATLQRLPIQEQGKLPPELATKVDEAIALVRQVEARDRQPTEAMRRSLFLQGRAAELRGDHVEAKRLYTRTLQRYGDSPEGLAAKMAEADMLRRSGDDQAALVWYRQVLQAEIDPATYRSDVLPVGRLQERILQAVGDFVDKGLFGHAITMLDRFPPLFSRTEELEIRGVTLRSWGDRLLRQAANDGDRSQEVHHAGLRRLREAGVAFERLAALRFATPFYTNHVWNSADCFFRGHSYSSASRMLDVYLKNEPENRNALALLRLGQANLAIGHVDPGIEALQECIELYERDNATYQARIDCAKAYWFRGDAAEAERLLRVNLSESTLKPRSPEWKDSLFALGRLLFEQGRYEDAISTLEEAIERYPDDRQALEARYLAGEAYRRWAADPLERLQQARTVTERNNSQRLVQERLTQALQNFKEVQSSITLQVINAQEDPIYGAMRRNCYVLEGAVLFDLGRYSDAIEAFQNVSSLYPNQPFVLETFMQIAHCWRRLGRAENARGAIEQAQLTLEQMPGDADFTSSTAFSREEWRSLLNNLRQW